MKRFAWLLLWGCLFTTTILAQNPATRPVRDITAKKQMRRTDTVPSLEPFLQQKAACEMSKSIDAAGNIIIRYADGFTKKLLQGKYPSEVITPDGVRHVPQRPPMITEPMMVNTLPPPLPPQGDPMYKWLERFNKDLGTDIKQLIAGSSYGWDGFLQDEDMVCHGNIFKQIQFRTIFLAKFNAAK